jgi:uncharacterized SAM-binding protein YcdF (DUF218 family)
MNNAFALLGIESWKPILTALLLPPVPFLVLLLLGARLMLPRRGWGWTLIVLGVAGLWLTSTMAAGRWLEQMMLRVPPALSADRIQALKAQTKGGAGTAIVVLGGGLEPFAPEYGVSNLTPLSVERLRYGLWLSRETGLPVAFSGGSGWGQALQGATEADAAARIAAQEFGRPLRWTESESRDTRENAARTVPMLRKAGIKHIVLVSHGWHLPRARHHFEAAAADGAIRIEPAPMGLAKRVLAQPLDWLPSADGLGRVRHIVREALGRLLGA